MFGVLPFEIFRQDKDEVILLINYLIEKGDELPPEAVSKSNKGKDDFWNF